VWQYLFEKAPGYKETTDRNPGFCFLVYVLNNNTDVHSNQRTEPASLCAKLHSEGHQSEEHRVGDD